MWLYRETAKQVWNGAEDFKFIVVYQVGYLALVSETSPQLGSAHLITISEFIVVEELPERETARRSVNFLNGGSPDVWVSGKVDIGTE